MTEASTQRRRAVCACLLLLVLAVSLAAVSCAEPQPQTRTLSFPPLDEPLDNPFIGNVAWATSTQPREQAFRLVYADLTWAQLEPERGQYDFAAFEERCNLAYWREQGKHIIFRFVLDVPGNKPHCDIPDWLWELTRDGQDYDNSYGKGYCPNYANPVLIQEHARAIAALGERYGSDPRFAFVQLGSLGHWGEWHIRTGLPDMPLTPVRDQYVQPYLEAFPKARLMMRRPFSIAAEKGLGLFNDTSAEENPTREWLDWIQNGGVYSQTGEPQALVPMPEAWKTAPVGGELTQRIPTEDLLAADRLPTTLALMKESHTSWIGPSSFVHIPRDGPLQKAVDQINRQMGYRLRVSDCQVTETADGQVTLVLTWMNDGIAPFYFDWQPAIRVTVSGILNQLVRLDVRLSDVLPGVPVRTAAQFSIPPSTRGEWAAWVGIMDPAKSAGSTGSAGIALAMSAEQQEQWYRIAWGKR